MEKEFFEGLENFMKNISDWIPSEDTIFNLLKAEAEIRLLLEIASAKDVALS